MTTSQFMPSNEFVMGREQASTDLKSMITATLAETSIHLMVSDEIFAFSGGVDPIDDTDDDGDVTTFSVTETASSTATDIATITVTDPDDTYTVDDFTVSDDRLELITSSPAEIFTLRIRAGAFFDYDETPGAGGIAVTDTLPVELL